jgi:hypothetical protein
MRVGLVQQPVRQSDVFVRRVRSLVQPERCVRATVRGNHRAQRVDHVIDLPARRGERHESVLGMAILRVLEEPIGRGADVAPIGFRASACPSTDRSRHDGPEG